MYHHCCDIDLRKPNYIIPKLLVDEPGTYKFDFDSIQVPLDEQGEEQTQGSIRPLGKNRSISEKKMRTNTLQLGICMIR